MDLFADRYQFRARAAPEFLVMLPIIVVIIIALISFSSNESDIILGIFSLLFFFIFFQGNFGRNAGKKLEAKLLKNGELIFLQKYLVKKYEKNQNHKHILCLKKIIRQYEFANPFDEDVSDREQKVRMKIISKLIINKFSHDPKRFPIAFDKNCVYGFFRTMLAVRQYAVASMAIATAIVFVFVLKCSFNFTYKSIILTCESCNAHFGLSSLFAIIGIAWIVWLVFWYKVISLAALKGANEDYIDALLGAVFAEIKAVPNAESKQGKSGKS